MKKPSLAAIFWTLCVTCLIWMLLITTDQFQAKKPTISHTTINGNLINADDQ